MSRYYKTSKSAPIVDYVPDYPFEELFKATKYRNDLQDTRVEKLNQAYDDVLGLNFIPGTTDANGVYQPSPSEQYVKQKRQEAEDLINKYSNVDLTKSAWGNISRDITQLTNDPMLADIQTSYNNYIKNIAHQRELDKDGRLPSDPWGVSGDPTQQMWDVQTQGIYPFMPAQGFDDPSQLLERYYKDMNVEERFDPVSGLILKDVTQDDITRVAKGMDETFMNTPAGRDAIAEYRINNGGAPNMTDQDIARQVIADYGQKYLGRDITGGSTSNQNNKNKNNNSEQTLSDLDRALLPGTSWAVSNDAVTTPEIMDKVATPLGDGIYTLDAGTPVYLNPVEVDRTGGTNDLITAYNVNIAKMFIDQHGDKLEYLKHHYGNWSKDNKFLGWRDMDLEKQMKALYGNDWLSNEDDRKIKQAKKVWKQNLEVHDKNKDGKITEKDYPDIDWKKTNFPNFAAWYKGNLAHLDPSGMAESIAYKNKTEYEKGFGVWAGKGADVRQRDEKMGEYNAIVADFATKYNVDVMNPALQELVLNYNSKKIDSNDLDGLSKDEIKHLMSIEFTDLAGRGGVWEHISNAPTKNMIIDQDANGMPVTGKFIQGNMIFTEKQLSDFFRERGYDDDLDWWDSNSWMEVFVGPDSDYNMLATYSPSPASSLYDKNNPDQEMYILRGAWRQVNDDWAVANNINQSFYGTGKSGNQERLLQEELYQQVRAGNRKDAIFGQVIESNNLRNWINTRLVYGNLSGLPAGTIGTKNKVASNINDFIETEINSEDPDRINAAKSLEKYLTDNNLWQNGYNTSGTFGTGEIIDQTIYEDEDSIPWENEDNQGPMLIGQFVDLFKNKITTQDQRNLIYDHIAPWGNDGSYGGVQYIKDDKFVNTEAGINAYKKHAEAKANRMGLSRVGADMFSNLDFSKDVYAPFVSNATKQVMNNINKVATALEEPLVITGLYRTAEYNASLGGSSANSAHIEGRAIDIRLNDKFAEWLEGSQMVQKVSKGDADPKYVVYSVSGLPIFTVLKEDDHFHVEVYNK